MFEIWVYSPRVEGVHLRFGKVARGGLRWSDRREDFRTEVLGLVKAQMVKNAVIVPTGAKGGFFAKALPDPTVDREAWLAEGIAAYKLFISGLLDVTDNLVGTEVVPPQRVVRHDEDDTYLVVAADKGTATFSDIANGVAQSTTASGSTTRSPPAARPATTTRRMGITARGAWESVKRHFREMGVDTQTQDFTVVGVGDMSGDVFGNGMLLSEHIRLVAAFDHRHIFLDPDPDAATSYAERRRLFDLPRSSWADYDDPPHQRGRWRLPAVGQVGRRSARRWSQALGLAAGVDATMTPADLMKAILLAPVDLLWNGGIGTYVKASTETNAEIGDRANDAIRVNGKALRCKVVGEGGNLGASQLGRIEAALRGVRVNTDAIDNSAGVDTSDHEVNIKILLTAMTREGDMTLKQRNALLASMTDDVGRPGAARQLRAERPARQRPGPGARDAAGARAAHPLARGARRPRPVAGVPAQRRRARPGGTTDGVGLTSPEFSVLVAYAKLALKADLLPSALPDDPWFQSTLADYFPGPIRERYRDQLREPPAAPRDHHQRGGQLDGQPGRHHLRLPRRRRRPGRRPSRWPAPSSSAVRSSTSLATSRRSRRSTTSSPPTPQTDALPRVPPAAGPLGALVPAEPSGLARRRRRGRAVPRRSWPSSGRRCRPCCRATSASASSAGSPELEAAGCADRDRDPRRRAAGPVLAAGRGRDRSETGRDAGEVAPVYFATSEQFGIDGMLMRVTRLPRDDRWDALARGALRDDLYAVLESLTKSVLDASEPGQTAAERIAQWSKTNADSLDPGPHRAARASSGSRTRASPRSRWRCAPCAGSSAAGRPRPEPAGGTAGAVVAALGSGPCPP